MQDCEHLNLKRLCLPQSWGTFNYYSKIVSQFYLPKPIMGDDVFSGVMLCYYVMLILWAIFTVRNFSYLPNHAPSSASDNRKLVEQPHPAKIRARGSGAGTSWWERRLLLQTNK